MYDYEPINDAEDQQDAVRLGLIDYDDVYCVHGTFVGGWAGPDYICGYCEEGISPEQLEDIRLENERLARRWARVRMAQLERLSRWHGEAREEDPALFDSIVRLSVWLMRRDHWK